MMLITCDNQSMFCLQLQCCGAYGDIESPYAWAIYKGHSEWKTQQSTRKYFVYKIY